jgi:hypothetical protein
MTEGVHMKINYESNQLTISDVSMDLFKKIIETIEGHEAECRDEQKAERWRTLAKEDENTRLNEAS